MTAIPKKQRLTMFLLVFLWPILSFGQRNAPTAQIPYSLVSQGLQDLTQYNQYSGFWLSTVGNYSKESMAIWESSIFSIQKKRKKLSLDSLGTGHSTSELLERIKDKQIVIFNEAHYNPRHRNFIAQQLETLKNAGFTHLCLEGLNPKDKAVAQFGFPIDLSGMYTHEPEYANMIRVASNLGLEVLAYEHLQGKTKLEREQGQAQNLTSILRTNPKAKLIVLAGFGHVLETPKHEMMAFQLIETGYNPFTIDQYKMSLFDLGNQQSLVHFMTPVLQQTIGEEYMVDAVVTHPLDIAYKQDRPNWKGATSYYQPINIKTKTTESFLLLVFDAQELRKSTGIEDLDTIKTYINYKIAQIPTPIDIIELNAKKQESQVFVFEDTEPVFVIMDKQKVLHANYEDYIRIQ